MGRPFRCWLGHDVWWYDDPEPPGLDFVLGCHRCKDPDLVLDRVRVVTVEGRPDLVAVEPEGWQRLVGFLRGAARG